MSHNSENTHPVPSAPDQDPSLEDEAKYGIEPTESNDVAVGAEIGGVGGAITGAIAGAGLGIPGALTGAVIGGVLGAAGSAAAVAAVDKVDSDHPQGDPLDIEPMDGTESRLAEPALDSRSSEGKARNEEADESYALTVDGRDRTEIPIPIVPASFVPGPSAAGVPGVLPEHPLNPNEVREVNVELLPEPDLAEDGTPNGVPIDTVDHVRKSPMK